MPATRDPAPADGDCALGFDFGTRLVGVAVGNRITGSASALTSIANGDWPRFDALIAEWRPARLIVGLPLALDGGEQAASRGARAFAAALENRYGLVVELVDERYSSAEAARRFAARRATGGARRKDAHAIDALAAAVILEDWLAHTPRRDT